jgi:ABC-2 type transport system permease protein
MNNFAQAIWVETLKARRSRLPWITAAGFAILPLVGGLFMLIIRDPEFARRAGLISAKAELTMGAADWPTYLNFLGLGSAVGGLIFFSFVISWVFGREFAERTVKDLLALPTPRPAIVAAKFVVVAGWCAGLVLEICLLGLAVGALMRLPPVAAALIAQGLLIVFAGGLMTVFISLAAAFFASAGRGYLPGVAAALLLMVAAQVLGVLGWAEYFPWAVPGLYAQGVPLGPASYLLLLATGAAGIAATLLWWQRADQAQ